jgi:exodeoxyribonuclease-5
MTELTADQAQALEKIKKFLGSPSTTFLLEGGAGVGKTFLLGQLFHSLPDSMTKCVAAPTHKAINVLRRKLDAFNVEWCLGFDDYTFNGTDVITGTTAQLLGIGPVISDEQDTKVKFGKKGSGILSKIKPSILVIDEVSMLGWRDLQDLHKIMKAAGCHLLVVGDEAQLPPVKQERIPFDKLSNKASLRQVVRQAEGSAIITLAWSIRDGGNWNAINGTGIRRTKSLADSFISDLKNMDGAAEEDRSVFIAYTNRRVNEVQERACQKLYKHGRLAFAPGELVLSETNYYDGKILMCSNQEELMVDSFREEQRNPTTGVPVVLHSRANQAKFTASYLTPEELADPKHPYRVELKVREELAQSLQNKWKGCTSWEKDQINRERKEAWKSFFEWRDQTVMSFRHPFSITSHKSQGSTYRAVYADTVDLARFSTQALYVAVTRPKDELILSE